MVRIREYYYGYIMTDRQIFRQTCTERQGRSGRRRTRVREREREKVEER